MVFCLSILSRLRKKMGTEKWRCCYNKHLKCGSGCRNVKWIEAGRILRCRLEKVFIAVKAQLRVILKRAQKENKQAVVKASIFLEKIQVFMNRKLVDIWAAKVIQMRSKWKWGTYYYWQLEERQSLLWSGEEFGWIVFVSWYFVESEWWKWYLNEEISKQNIEGAA